MVRLLNANCLKMITDTCVFRVNKQLYFHIPIQSKLVNMSSKTRKVLILDERIIEIKLVIVGPKVLI